MAYNGQGDGYNSHGMQDLNPNPAGVRDSLLLSLHFARFVDLN